MQSWIPVPDGSDFPLENLPYGATDTGLVVAIGDHVVNLGLLAEAGLLPDDDVARACMSDLLNPLLALGRPAWRALRKRLTHLLAAATPQLRDNQSLRHRAVLPRADVALRLPTAVGDYVDFYSSLEHATNLGRLFRPDGEPLLPNWRHMPVGYHGRSGTLVVSGTQVTRPSGQQRPGEDGRSRFGPSRMLDIELELGFVTGVGPPMGTSIPTARAADYVFGLVLVNDWSARDIQAWEYQPLGPFLGKSFATAMSPWVVPLDALDSCRVPSPRQDPPVLDYLQVAEDWGLDIELEVRLATSVMSEPTRISATNARRLYWTIPQQLAHATVNGASVRAGDLFASGTISGDQPGTEGSLIELTWGGKRPLTLPDGSTRTFVEDGDTVVLSGHAGGNGTPRIGFGEVHTTIRPSPPS